MSSHHAGTLPVELTLGHAAHGPIAVRPVTEDEVEAARQGGDGELAACRDALTLSRFQGRAGTWLPTVQDGTITWWVGRGNERTTQSLRRAVATGMSLLADDQPWSVVLPMNGLRVEDAVRAAAEGAQGANYRCRRTGGEDKRKRRAGPGRLVVPEVTAAAETALREAQGVMHGVHLARDLVNAPANELGPEELAAATRDVAARHGMKATTWTGDELLERGFRMVHTVGRASSRPPTFTVVEVGDVSQGAMALAGKGVVFDSGGLNLKPSAGMLLMRKDMGGAGTVIGALDALGRVGFQGPLLVLIPAAENAISGNAYRPGDILQAYDGTTVEIGNTDAEGRLLLGDALCYAVERGATRILDLATLTGAARVALGPDVPALFGNDESMVRALLEESARHDEGFWRMPLVRAYDALLDTPFADVNHISSDSRGGAITAALFLQRFVKDTPWTHIDLNAWEDKGKPETPRGANGQAVRGVVSALRRLAAE